VKQHRQIFTKVAKCLLVFLSIALIPFSACTPAEPTPAGAVVDDLGRSVNIEKIPQRIISLAPSNTEILFALGLGEKVVGVTEYCNYPPEALDKEKVGGFSTPDIEKIIALEPDLILASSIHAKEIIPALEERGLIVFAIEPKDLDELFEDIKVVGKITGKEKEASELVAQMERRVKAVTEKTDKLREDQRPRVFYPVWHDPLWTVGSETFVNELIEKAGGVNIFQDIKRYKTVDLETVIARNPEIIIAAAGHEDAGEELFKWVKSELRLRGTEAHRNNRVYRIDSDTVERAGPRIVEGLEVLAKCIHPEIFGVPKPQEEKHD